MKGDDSSFTEGDESLIRNQIQEMINQTDVRDIKVKKTQKVVNLDVYFVSNQKLTKLSKKNSPNEKY
jgi:nicotinamide riboside kinase